jgi:hypothetical protein
LASNDLKRFSRAHLDGALALMGAEGWETYLTRAGDQDTGLVAQPVPGFRLTREEIECAS